MAKGLKGVIRLRKWEVDEKRRILRQLQEREDQILDFMRQLAEQKKAEAEMVRRDTTGAGFTFGAYTQWARKQQQDLETVLDMVRQQIAQAQDAVAQAFKELKTFEIAQANREAAARAEQDRKTQIMLDDIGQEAHRRKQRT